MITLIALSRLIEMEPNNQKERKNNETTNPLQKNKNSSKYTPKPWRVLRVSDEHSRPKPLRLG